jgi:glycosyltransferase involved in cell wall biosynthesis
MNTIKVVVPVRNARDWISKCIFSIASQDYQGSWSCIIVDDASDDNTQDEITRTLKSLNDDVRSKFSVKFNESRVGALKNFIDGFKELKSHESPEAILVQLDGDDWLFGPLVFQIINQAYNQTNCWMTWGSYVEWPSGAPGMSRPIPSEVHVFGDYRNREWMTSHLRTFKSHLWNSINDRDLRDEDGNYFMTTCDLAMMFPMLEMSRERSLFIPYVLHCYNRTNPLSDDKVHREDQLRAEGLIRSRRPYSRK